MLEHKGMGTPHHQEKIGEQKPEVSSGIICCSQALVGKEGCFSVHGVEQSPKCD